MVTAVFFVFFCFLQNQYFIVLFFIFSIIPTETVASEINILYVFVFSGLSPHGPFMRTDCAPLNIDSDPQALLFFMNF